MTIVEPQNLSGVQKTNLEPYSSDTWNPESTKIEDPLHPTFSSAQTTSFYHPSPHPYAQPPGWAASMMQHNGGGGVPGDQRYGLPSGMDYASAAAATAMGHHPHPHHPSASTHPGLATLDPHSHYGLQAAPHHPAGIHPAHVPGGNSLSSKRNADSAGIDMMGQDGGGSSDEDDGSMDIKPSLSERGRGTPLKSPGSDSASKKTRGRVKIKMEFIDNKLRRYTTFSKRKTGIMKKAYELSTLTGTQVMLLVASETGHVYTFATRKLQPMITSDAGKALIQTCLNSPDPPGQSAVMSNDQRMSATGFEETELTYNVADDVAAAAEQQQKESDLEVIDEEEEEDYSRYVEEEGSEDEPDQDDGEDEEVTRQDQVSITQVRHYKKSRLPSKDLETFQDDNDSSCEGETEEQEAAIASSSFSTANITRGISAPPPVNTPSSVGMSISGNRKPRKEKAKPNVVTIRPVNSKPSPTTSSPYSTTLSALQPTLVTPQTPGFVIVPNHPSMSSSTQSMSGSHIFQNPTVVGNFSPNSLPNLVVAKPLVVGGHVFKQEGTTITLQNPSTSTILVPAPISTMISAASVQPSSVSIPMTLANEQIFIQSSSTTKPTQSHPKKRKHK